jgi:hypothetical protein
MSIKEILEELPKLSLEERQQLRTSARFRAREGQLQGSDVRKSVKSV